MVRSCVQGHTHPCGRACPSLCSCQGSCVPLHTYQGACNPRGMQTLGACNLGGMGGPRSAGHGGARSLGSVQPWRAPWAHMQPGRVALASATLDACAILNACSILDVHDIWHERVSAMRPASSSACAGCPTRRAGLWCLPD